MFPDRSAAFSMVSLAKSEESSGLQSRMIHPAPDTADDDNGCVLFTLGS
jgi:hypothetical protein